MDITTGELPPPSRPDAPEIAGRRIDWGPRDVLFGIFWFVGVLVAAQVIILPLAVIYGAESSALYGAAFVSAAAAEIGFAVIAAAFTFRRYGGGLERLGVGPITRSTLLWAAAAFFAALLASGVYAAVINVLGLDFLKSDCAEQIPKAVRDQRLLLTLAAIDVIAFAPICEELFFRAFVFPGLAARWGPAAGIIASGLLFASAHLLYKSFIPIAAVGMILPFAYFRSRNIASAMIAHFAFNSVSIAAIAAGQCDSSTSGSIPFIHLVTVAAARVAG